MAGTSPNSRPVATATAVVNASTGASIVNCIQNGMPPRMFALIHWRNAYANAMPSAAPMSATMTLSVSSWRTMRQRSAPSATRTAISFERAVARARSRLATFAHAMSSTNATDAIMIISTGRKLPACCSRIVCASTPQPRFDAGYCVSSADGDGAEIVAHLLDRDAGLEPPDHLPRVIAAIVRADRACIVVHAPAAAGNSKPGGMTPMTV